jgi:NAD dependent epimerase/dehydratase family enzyme
VLSGRRVISKKLKENNYNFNYQRFDEAIANMLNK